MLKNISIRKKIYAGFSIMLVMLGVVVCLSFLGAGGIMDNAKEVIYGDKLQTQMTQKELDHLNWVNKVNALLSDDEITTLDVQTDDHKCAFGKWLYSEDRKEAETKVEGLKDILKSLEEPHRKLHQTAINIKKHFKQADSMLPGQIAARQVDHLKWATKIRNCILFNHKRMSVATDPTKCALGKWLASEEAKAAYENGGPQFKGAWDKLVVVHKKLHESAVKINTTYTQIHPGLTETLMKRLLDHKNWAAKVSQAIIEGNPDLGVQTDCTKCAYGKFLVSQELANITKDFVELKQVVDSSVEPHKNLHESAIMISEALAKGVEGKVEAETIFKEKTQAYLEKIGKCFQDAIQLETALVNQQDEAKRVFSEVTEPLLQETLGELTALKTAAEQDMEGMNKANNIYAHETAPLLKEIQTLLKAARKKMKENLMTQEAMLNSVQSTKTQVGLIGCLGVVAGLLLSFFITRMISKPLDNIMKGTDAIARGDLDFKLYVTSKDEFGRLAESFTKMIENLKESNKDSNIKLDYLNNIPTPVMAVDRDFTVQFMDKAGCDLLGMAPEEIIGSKCYDLFKTTHCNTSKCQTARAMEQNGVFTGETVADPGGLNLPISYTGAPLKNKDGEIIGALEYVIDISTQKSVQSGVKESVNTLGDVVNNVTTALNEMSEKSSNIADQSNNVAMAAEEMSQRMNSISTSASSSQENINAVATATEEMTVTVTEISKNSEQARCVTENAVKNVATASERVNELGDAAKEISKVIETIVEIAEQTKLLALNANIEAARAGDAGKGFSVVASEVKELAKQTSNATEDIRSKIEAIQSSTKSTIGEIETITTVIHDVDEIVSTIATAVEEQSCTTKEIAGNIVYASEGIQDMVKDVMQSIDMAKDVAEHIGNVNSNIEDVNTTSHHLNQNGEKLKTTGDNLTSVVNQFDTMNNP